jgi:hypothetical protein
MDNFNGGGSIAKDLQASFQATGIFPLNKQKVLDKLPNTDNTNIINDTVTEYLKNQRNPNCDEQARKKRKKLNVIAGASITSVTLGLNDVISDEELEENNLLVLTNDSESDHEPITVESIPEYQQPSDLNIKIGTFILVHVKSGKHQASTYIYLAVIKNIEKNNGYSNWVEIYGH